MGMSREEGKEFANALKNNYTIDFDKLPDFCDLVISALQKNESAEEWYKLLCEKWDSAEGEYIKKEDALFKKWQFKFKDVDGEHWFVNVKDIESLPTYSFPDREKGEWIECHPLQPDDTAYMCSKCHSGDYGCERYDFCPWCGADMRGKANES